MKPQFYRFQIKGYEESYPDIYMMGLGIIDDDKFTGNLKHEKSNMDLKKEAYFNTGTDPASSWHSVYSLVGGGGGDGNNYTSAVSQLPVTNVSNIDFQSSFKDIVTMYAVRKIGKNVPYTGFTYFIDEVESWMANGSEIVIVEIKPYIS